MKVLMFLSTLRGNDGGAEHVFGQLASDLEARDHEVVRAWAFLGESQGRTELVFPLETLAFVGYRATLLRKVPSVLRSLWRLVRGLRHIRPDIVNVHFVCAEAWYFIVLRRFFGYKVVLTFHGSDAHLASGRNLRLLPSLVRRADRVTVVSERVLEAVQAITDVEPSSISLIPNGIPLEFWSRPTGRDALRYQSRTVIAVGRLERVKGYDVLMRAMSSLIGLVPDARLILIGEGSERRQLEEEADRLGMTTFVTMTGRLDAGAIRERLNRAAAFVLPSRSEGLPLALLEAMASGLPVVATGVGGVPEVLTPQSGIIVPPDTPHAIAKALASIMSDPTRAQQMGAEARVRAQSFSSERAADAYERLFMGLSEGTGFNERRAND
jgi:glycosyltransferase involved in cell wall biosynthesis